MRQAMIFAAGLGTRLKPITDHMPKALVRVGEKPLLDHVLDKMQDAGFERIVINIHHFADQIVDYVQSHPRGGMEILFSDEREALLETGGGLRKAASLFSPDSHVLIHNVDILSNVDIGQLYDLSTEADATLLVSERQTNRYLLFDDHMQMKGWTHTGTGEVRSPYPDLDPQRYTKLAFSGIHVISPALLRMMQGWPERFSIIDFYLSQCDKIRIMGHLKKDLRLMDVGKLETLEDANRFITQL